MRFDLLPLQLSDLVDQSLEATNGYATRFNVGLKRLAGCEDAAILADGDRLMQVMSNLLSNAIKFSPPGEDVAVSITCAGDTFRVSIANGGEGIPEDFKGRIFSRFAQADGSSTRAQGGTGLGLNIVKEIISKMNGTVGFESTPGEGATFYFDLPAMRASAAKTEGPVLLCAKEAAQGSFPAGSNINVQFVTTMEQLEDATAARRFAAIVLDFDLDDACRFEILKHIREKAGGESTSIVVLSKGDLQLSGHQDLREVLTWASAPRKQLTDIQVQLKGPADSYCLLHVEDDADVRALLQQAFGEDQVLPAANLTEAREALAKNRIEAVVLDLDLGGESGLQLLPDLQTASGRPIPVVIFSAVDDDRNLASADAVLTKSRVTFDQVVDTVRSLLNSSARDQV